MMQEAGPCPDKRWKNIYSSFSNSRMPPWLQICRKAPWRSIEKGHHLIVSDAETSGSWLLPCPGKVIGHSLPVDWQSMTRIAGQLREEARPCPDNFSFSKSGDLPNHTCAEKLLGGQREVMPREAHHPQSFAVEFILAKRCMSTHGRILRYIKYRLWTRKVKMIGQRKPRRNAP